MITTSANTPTQNESRRIAVIGAGPAGLMAADKMSLAGYQVDVFDTMPSVARKFLLAGIGGMNITHAEDYDTLITRYGSAQTALKPILDELPPLVLREWIHELGVDTFVGSSQRVFPTDMKAAPYCANGFNECAAIAKVGYLRLLMASTFTSLTALFSR